jgi:aminopeptidase YwaD
MKLKTIIAFAAALTTLQPITAQTTNPVEILRNHVTILASDSLAGRGFGFPDKRLATNYITNQYTAAGFAAPFEDTYIHTFLHEQSPAMITGRNIIGVIEGSDPQLKNEYILLGAHYDHLGWKSANGERIVYNGADDNASGVAAIIEIGKLLMGNRGALGRSVIIAAFDGEEAGLLGSGAFARSMVGKKFDVKMMFSLDMVGMLSTNSGLNHSGFRAVPGAEELATDIIRKHGIEVTDAENKIEMRTDTWPFAKQGVPAVYISTGLLSPYHKPEDDAELLDYEGIAKVVDMMTELTIALSNSESLEADSRYIARKVDPAFQFGFRGGYGTTSHAHKTEFFNAKPVFAAEYGPEVQLRLSRNLRLQPALLYQYAGSRTAAGKLRTHSVVPQLDLLLTTKSRSIADPLAFFLAGGYYSYAFAGKEADAPADFTSKYSDTDIGLRFGGGISIMKRQFTFVFKHGFKRVNLSEEDGKLFNRGFFVASTFYF